SQVIENAPLLVERLIDRLPLLLREQVNGDRQRHVPPLPAGLFADRVLAHLRAEQPLEQLPHVLFEAVLLLAHHLERVDGGVIDSDLWLLLGHRRLVASSASTERSPLFMVMCP